MTLYLGSGFRCGASLACGFRVLPAPTTHDFAASTEDRTSCEHCSGPLGVHVRPRVETSA